MTQHPVLETFELGQPWTCFDPFIFTVHHLDTYPDGTANQGINADALGGRNIGSDFSYLNGWSMYHGSEVPGFPQHPHRGFETVTVQQRGFTDHSDSLGATARYGEGDTQWLTAGSGIMHSEMFPLIKENADNTMELFQIWLNLPPENKMVDAHFGMLWKEDIPTAVYEGGAVQVEVIAGQLDSHTPSPPNPESWASDPRSELAIWVIKMEAGSSWTLPASSSGLNRTLYCYEGEGVSLDGTAVTKDVGARLRSEKAIEISVDADTEFLLLQARPIGAPVFQMGPFVMNTPEELQEAFADYRRTAFGGWPWATPDPVHDRTQGRFAIHADGRREERTTPAAL
jgi:redox-sensitive bicupin YhaK (pirin superfamily)